MGHPKPARPGMAAPSKARSPGKPGPSKNAAGGSLPRGAFGTFARGRQTDPRDLLVFVVTFFDAVTQFEANKADKLHWRANILGGVLNDFANLGLAVDNENLLQKD